MTQSSDVEVLSKPDTMGTVLAQHYSDYPLCDMPKVAMRILGRRWQRRPDVFYVEARTRQGAYMGFLFGHTLGEAPWKGLMSDPVWMAPCAAMPILSRALRKRRSGAESGPEATASMPTEPAPMLDLPPMPPDLLQSGSYLKMEYMEVEPEFRGMRVAHHLYMGMEKQARLAGVRMLSSRIAVHNVASVKALHRAGYTVYVRSPSELRSAKMLDETEAV